MGCEKVLIANIYHIIIYDKCTRDLQAVLVNTLSPPRIPKSINFRFKGSPSFRSSLQAPGSDGALYHRSGFAHRGTVARARARSRTYTYVVSDVLAVTGYIRRPIKRAK